jgi:enoyl-CoA hydratase
MSTATARCGIRLDVVGAVATVTIDAPPVNAFTVARYRALRDTFTAIGERSDVHCVVFTATGTRAFCAGLDIHEFLAAPIEQDEHRQRVGAETFLAIKHCPVPVICAVNGPALGAGAVFAALSDIRIASERASFALPEINVGRCGGAAYVGALVPPGLVRRMFFTGLAISAAEAYRVGFVDQLVPAERLLSSAFELAETIAAKAPLGLRIGKESLNAAEGLPAHEGYLVEQTYSARLLETEDAREALRAVVEKRPPVFRGR